MSIYTDESNAPILQYLGPLNRVSGTTILVAGRNYRLPLQLHPLPVFPGEQIPMILSARQFSNIQPELMDAGTDGVASNADAGGSLFGLFFPRQSRHDGYYGVTCQVHDMSDVLHGVVRLRATAQQRFHIAHKWNLHLDRTHFDRLTSLLNRPNGPLQLHVTVLPEVQLRDPLFGYENNSWLRLRQSTRMASRLRSGWAASLPWPRFVYDQYDSTAVMRKVRGFMEAMDISEYSFI